jgi:hypothetical protein
MKPKLVEPNEGQGLSENLERAVREIVRAIQSVNYGSIEVVIHNSQVVQIERKEKFRFGKC